MTIDVESAKSVIRPVYFCWLDIASDPVWAWTGTYPIDMGSGNDDPLLDTQTFLAVGAMAEIGSVEDSENGGSPLQIRFPAVDPALPLFKQIISDAREWQYRDAVFWFSYVDGDGILLYEPRRLRTGKIDNLKLIHPEDDAVIALEIAGHTAHAQRALESRYIEQRELVDPTDSSQDWVHDLANKNPTLGGNDQNRGGGGSVGGGSIKDNDPIHSDLRMQ